MSSKKSISRKEFIKGCSATVGLMSLGISGTAFGQPVNDQMVADNRNPANADPFNGSTRRGSWLANPNQLNVGDVALVSPTVKCAIVISKNENSAVQQAALFLAADIEKISGYKPGITETAATGATEIHLVTLASNNLPADITRQLKDKHEAYAIKTDGKKIWLTGSDFRGTAFAAYTLSERLGIDPLYHWTGYQPQKKAQLALKATHYYSPPPVFKYRGFFNDDEDVLPRPFERTGYPLRIGDIVMEWYERYFETALRLGMNMAAPFCRVHRRYEVQKRASDWGLYYTSHHYDILLSNPFGIERYRLAEKRGVSSEWDWFKHKDNMMKYWRGGVEENKDLNAVWPVGLRGTDDHAYEFPENTPENVQAEVFREAIKTQVDTVKALAKKDTQPLFHFTMYTEMLNKYEQHADSFNVPEEVIIVWPDNDDGVMRSLPANKGKWKHGVYYHLAYFGKNVSKQGPHIISSACIATEFKKIKQAGATEFLLINVSEMREHVMEMRMLAELCHNETLFNEPDMADKYTQWWANEYFGPGSVNMCQKAYHQYFDLLSRPDKLWYGTDMVQNALSKLLTKIKGGPVDQPDAKDVKDLKKRVSDYHLAMAAIGEAEKTMGRKQQQFFFENLTLGLLMDFRPCQAAVLLLDALSAKSDNEQWNFINQAILPLQQLETELARAEHGPFERWYAETWIKTDVSPLNYHRAYKQVRELISTGGNMEIKTKMPIGHNIPGAQLWFDYLEAANKINPTY